MIDYQKFMKLKTKEEAADYLVTLRKNNLINDKKAKELMAAWCFVRKS